MKNKQDTFLLLFILLVGAILRFFHWNDIPFTYDEFSALFRTEFESLGELIRKGAKIDGHPAGIQVFLYYMVKIFGYSETAIKLPFILFGLGGIIYTWLIGKNWFGNTTGLVSAAFVATLQYTVMYSQIARPYISGFFFAGMMVYHWYRMIVSENRVPWLHMTLYILAASLCSYNHHFSLLFVAIVAITGLFLVKKKFMAYYLATGAVIFILYIPHLPIFFYQLSLGGVEQWLSKPDFNFLIQYVAWIFHYSVVLLIIVGILFAYSLFNVIKFRKINPYFLVSLIWVCIPIIAGFIYSIVIASVLQFSVLIFTFPFLLYVIFAGLPKMKFWSKSVLVIFLMFLSIYSLIKTRDHYKIFYESAYEQMIIEADHAKEKYQGDCYILLDTHKRYSAYYIDKHDFQIPVNYFDHNLSKPQIDSLLENIDSDYLMYGSISNTPSFLFSMIRKHYPNLILRKDYFIGNVSVFSRVEDQPGIEYRKMISLNPINPSIKDWSYKNSGILSDSIIPGNYFYHVMAEEEYCMTYSFPFKDHDIRENDFIDIRIRVKSDEPCGALIVSELIEKGETILWSGGNFSEYQTEGWFDVFHSIKLSDLRHTKFTEGKVYIWNKDKNDMLLEEVEITIRQGNPRLYGLFEDF